MRETVHRAVIIALHENPEWTLADLDARMDAGGPRAAALANLTVGALRSAGSDPEVRRFVAQRAYGPRFDALVHAVLVEARRPVGAAYVRARLGGLRWKLQGSFRRLVSAGLAERSGTTSNTRYRGIEVERRA